MNPPAQSATVWNIRNLLMTAVAPLSILGLAVSGYVLRGAGLQRATASDAASINETADLLLASAGQWARERGATNLALNAANPATDAQTVQIGRSIIRAGTRPHRHSGFLQSRSPDSDGAARASVSELAGGETSVVVPCSNRRDEMG